jgi:hypothetical protein
MVMGTITDAARRRRIVRPRSSSSSTAGEAAEVATQQ